MVAELLHKPYEFQFYKALEFLESEIQQKRTRDKNSVDSPAIMLRGHSTFGFVPSDIRAITSQKKEGKTRYFLEVAALGLYGATSPLAPELNEKIAAGDKEGQRIAAFLDLFNHRLLELWVGILGRAHHQTNLSHALPVPRFILAAIGVERGNAYSVNSATYGSSTEKSRIQNIGTAPLIPDLPKELFLDTRALPFLAMGRRSIANLSALLSLIAPGAAHKVQAGMIQDLPLKYDQKWQLGKNNNHLGQAITLGTHMSAMNTKMKLTLKPLRKNDFSAYTPEGHIGQKIKKIITHFTQGTMSCAWHVEAGHNTIEQWKLGRSDQKLNNDLWLGRPLHTQKSRAIFNIKEL